MGKGKGTSEGEMPSWPLTTVWGSVVQMVVAHHVGTRCPQNAGWAGGVVCCVSLAH